MIKVNIQLFGGRGTSYNGGGNTGGAGGGIQVGNDWDVRLNKSISSRDSLDVVSKAKTDFDVDSDVSVAELNDDRVMAFYTVGTNHITVNDKYYGIKSMDDAYDGCVKSGFHPSRGEKSGVEATVAHEMGHLITDKYAKSSNMNFHVASESIVSKALRAYNKNATTKLSLSEFRKSISGYGAESNAEAIAEAYSDVYCNGTKAKAQSQNIVKVLNNLAGKKTKGMI